MIKDKIESLLKNLNNSNWIKLQKSWPHWI